MDEDLRKHFDEHKRHMAVFASLSKIIDANNGCVLLNGNAIKKAYLDNENDCYMVEYNNGKKEIAYDVDTDLMFANINTWRENNSSEFNKIMGI